MKKAKPKEDRIIVCAALKDKKAGILICGARHFDMVMHGAIGQLARLRKPNEWDQGFIDQYGMFHDRKAALEIVKNNGQKMRGQPKDQLYSEDLY